MKYLIIGLGNYGGVLAEELSANGHEVIGVDQNEGRVDLVKDRVAASFVMDAADPSALDALPLKEIDVVIVAIRKDFGASVRVVALLKQKGVRHIYARAVDHVHRSILEAFEVDKVLTPAPDAARDFAQTLAWGVKADVFRIDGEYHVMKFRVPENCVGVPLDSMRLEEDFRLRLVALKHSREVRNLLGMRTLKGEVVEVRPDYVLEDGDELVCIGKYRDFQEFWKAL